MCLSIDGSQLFTGSQDKKIRMWDISYIKHEQEFIGHVAAVYCLCTSKDGRNLFSCGQDKTIKMWSVE